jgi:hypothetical protein
MILKDHAGQHIRLTDEGWDHILLDHPEMAEFKWTIGETLKSPDAVLFSKSDPDRVREFYKDIPAVWLSRFIRVVVCFEADSPFVLTAHPARRVPKEDRMTDPKQVSIWYDPEGDFLEVIWERKPGAFVETADGQANIKLDAQDNILGFQIQALSKITKPTNITFDIEDHLEVEQCRNAAVPPSGA